MTDAHDIAEKCIREMAHEGIEGHLECFSGRSCYNCGEYALRLEYMNGDSFRIMCVHCGKHTQWHKDAPNDAVNEWNTCVDK